MKRSWLVVGIVVAVVLTVVAIVVLRPKPVVPSEIKRSITSTLLVPKSPDVVVARESMKYDSELRLLTYTVTAYDIKTVLSEPPTP